MKNFRLGMAAVSALLLLASCGAKKAVVKDADKTMSNLPKAQKIEVATSQSTFAFVERVNDKKVDAQDIVADLDFTASMGGKDVSVPGSLHMRKDQMIRLQLFMPVLHTEVGRLEFTPEYVLVVDRLHKQYVKEDYRQIDFLKANGLDFNALQALFWNQLYLPGSKDVEEKNISKFKAELGGSTTTVPVSVRNGNLSLVWNVSRQTELISDVKATYASAQHGTSVLTMKYGKFKPVGAKMFPAFEELSFQTSATKKVQRITMTLDMDDISTSSKWSTETTLSSRYKKIEATDIFSKLFSM